LSNKNFSSEDSHSIAKFGRGGKKIIYSFLVAKKTKSQQPKINIRCGSGEMAIKKPNK
jgi:hypothetical protein